MDILGRVAPGEPPEYRWHCPVCDEEGETAHATVDDAAGDVSQYAHYCPEESTQ